jgi:hypothetical protein
VSYVAVLSTVWFCPNKVATILALARACTAERVNRTV